MLLKFTDDRHRRAQRLSASNGEAVRLRASAAARVTIRCSTPFGIEGEKQTVGRPTQSRGRNLCSTPFGIEREGGTGYRALLVMAPTLCSTPFGIEGEGVSICSSAIEPAFTSCSTPFGIERGERHRSVRLKVEAEFVLNTFWHRRVSVVDAERSRHY